MTIKEAREQAGLSRIAMAREFEIPIRTLENWDAGIRKPPVWAEKLILEKLERMSKRKITMRKFEVIEDNGGGLILVVFDGEDVIYLHAGYEYNPGQLTEDLEALKNGADPREWDGCEEDPQQFYEETTVFRDGEKGWEVVADNNGIYPDKMGNAARKEFGID